MNQKYLLNRKILIFIIVLKKPKNKESKPGGEYAQEREHEAERATSRQITETRSNPANTAWEENIVSVDKGMNALLSFAIMKPRLVLIRLVSLNANGET